MTKFVKYFYDVRKGEWLTVSLMFFLHFVLMLTLYLLKPARDSLFLSTIGYRQLPFMYLLLAVVAIPVSLLMSRYLRQYPSSKVLQYSLLFFIANLLALRGLFTMQVQWVYGVFYIWMGIFSILIMSQFWLFANTLFDAAQSKRLFPYLNLGAILGAIIGSACTSLLVKTIGLSTVNLLYISIIFLGICWFIVSNIAKGTEDSKFVTITKTSSHPGQTESTTDLFKTVANSRYQLLIAGIIGVAMLVSTLIDFQFKSIAAQTYTSAAGLASFLGYFYGGMSLIALLVQMLFSTQITKRLGLEGAVLTRPVGLLIGSVLLLVAPVLASVVFLEGFNRAGRYSIDKTGREQLFLPVPGPVKQKTKIFIDTFVDRIFRGIAGLFLLLFIFVMNLSVTQISYIVIACLLVWIALSRMAKKEYVEKFRTLLRQRFIDGSSVMLDLGDSDVLRSIREVLQGKDESRIIYVLGLLQKSKPGKLSDDLKKLLAHPHREIRLMSLKNLHQINSVKAASEVTVLLEDPDPEVRVEAVYYLSEHEEKKEKIIEGCLNEGNDELKCAALGCKQKHKMNDGHEPDIDENFIQKAINSQDKNAAMLRAQVAHMLGYEEDARYAKQYLPVLLHQNEPAVVRETLRSMKRLKNEVFLDALFRKLIDAEYTALIQKVLAAYGEIYFDRFRSLFFDKETEREVRRKIPGIFVASAQQHNIEYLIDMLKISDPILRYHVLKALNKLHKKEGNFRFHEEKLKKRLQDEAHLYFQLLSIKLVQPGDISDNILVQALEEKKEQAIERIFRILGLIHSQQDMYGSFLAIRANNRDAKATAIEFLDNILYQQEKAYIFPLVDTISENEKLQKGRKVFNLPVDSYTEGMMELLDGNDLWLKTCTVFSISSSCPQILQDRVQNLSTSRQPEILRETAQYVAKRNQQK